MANGLACAGGAGRDRGYGEDLRDDPCCTESSDPAGRGILGTHGRKPGGDRSNWSTTDEGGAGRTGASAGEAARRCGAARATATARTRGGRATGVGRGGAPRLRQPRPYRLRTAPSPAPRP